MMATAIGEKSHARLFTVRYPPRMPPILLTGELFSMNTSNPEIEQQYNRQAYCEKCRKYRKRREVGKSEKQNRLNGG